MKKSIIITVIILISCFSTLNAFAGNLSDLITTDDEPMPEVPIKAKECLVDAEIITEAFRLHFSGLKDAEVCTKLQTVYTVNTEQCNAAIKISEEFKSFKKNIKLSEVTEEYFFACLNGK